MFRKAKRRRQKRAENVLKVIPGSKALGVFREPKEGRAGWGGWVQGLVGPGEERFWISFLVSHSRAVNTLIWRGFCV